ncbi:hypothetical protein [Tautonia rosea]|uniref:hypothetical protein n=1 Tax=Tautonia rosea TaxID=2728037 RepID=UPI00147444DF|nr:hypothetical protein [Tautonia rosea]
MRSSIISRLLMLVLLTGIVVALLRPGAGGWLDPIFTLLLGLYAAAILGAFVLRKSGRRFMTAAAISGWGYLGLGLGAGLEGPHASLTPDLPTSRWLTTLHDATYDDAFLASQTLRFEYCSCVACETEFRTKHREQFLRVGHGVIGVVLASAVGLITLTRSIHSRSEENRPLSGSAGPP